MAKTVTAARGSAIFFLKKLTCVVTFDLHVAFTFKTNEKQPRFFPNFSIR
jgi:hypothetical protein